ncbi:MAG TPA: hypothetical protein VMW56_11735 [Candidatus Margulisiibacteriota bacterium]|nr:hypothetical protein [Candidatus Margulisiibacteriota bacterium]
MKSTKAIVIPNAQRERFPAQVRDPSVAPLEAEKRLMLAVLERAVDDFRTYAIVPTGRGQGLFMEVVAWFESSAPDAFDFEGICQATGLDPDCIRKCLRNWYDSVVSAARFDSRATAAQKAVLPTRYLSPRERTHRPLSCACWSARTRNRSRT